MCTLQQKFGRLSLGWGGVGGVVWGGVGAVG